jgi:2-oxoglutarate/2-oxoacid ferredoxin oxidoreductase subunit alpha
VAMIFCDGSEAIARGAIAAGLRFYAGYPMAPSSDLLEQLGAKLPEVGGVCINAETEISGVNMALGAAIAGARAATGSTGQGVALMQEAIAECALHETPIVIFTVGRMQQDYFQSTRGGGWGDYRTLCMAPKDVGEAFALTQCLFHLADKYRMPAILLTDGMLARTQVSVDLTPQVFNDPLPAKDWALDGSGTGTRNSKTRWTWNEGKVNNPGPGPQVHWSNLAAKFDHVASVETRWEAIHTEDADVLIVAFGTSAKFVEYVVHEMRAEGHKVGLFRPITLWPFPYEALEAAAQSARTIGVFELNAGQMIDDVRISIPRRNAIRAIGGISTDKSGLGIGELLDAPIVRARIEALLNGDRA